MRPRHPMPGFVREALEEHDLIAAYEARPPYQRNDYLGWITRAKREDTRQRRLAQMLDELRRGDVYMKMPWGGGRRTSKQPPPELADARDSRRIVVLGNSGSGKSTLAAQLSRDCGLAHFDLDALAWEPTTPPTRTPIDVAGPALREWIARHEGWVVEGCYADLIALVVDAATEMIFLDLSVEDCQANTRLREWEPHKYATKKMQEDNLPMLIEWIAGYPTRDGPLGRSAHLALFEAFEGKRERRSTRT